VAQEEGYELWIARTKWPDRPHYAHAGWALGEDEHGLWIELRTGEPVYRGDRVLFHGKRGGLMLVPPRDGWLAWFPASGSFELYVDVVTPPVRTAAAVAMVDLDFDVIRWTDGRVELVDEDEFEAHRVELGYPPEIVDHARREAAWVLAAVERGDEPFDGAAAAVWAARL
jgi:uncharacterized protein